MKVAIIGAGGIGKLHSSIYSMIPETEVIAIADIRLEHAQKSAEAHQARVYPSMEALLEAEKPDMVDICTPTYLHAEMAIECMKRGYHVLCEKPAALRLEDVQAMAATASEKGVFLMVAQVIRFWEEYIYLKQCCEDKSLGKLQQVLFSRISAAPRWSWENWFLDPKRSGVAPLDLHVHDADFIYYMLGKPQSVRSVGIQNEENYLTSYIKTQYDYGDGALVEAEGGWYNASNPFIASFRAVFEQAVLEYNGSDLMLYRAGEEAEKIEVKPAIHTKTEINLDSAGPYFNEIRYFIDCILNNTPPQIVTPQQSCGSLEMVLKEIESYKTGQTIKL